MRDMLIFAGGCAVMLAGILLFASEENTAPRTYEHIPDGRTIAEDSGYDRVWEDGHYNPIGKVRYEDTELEWTVTP